VGQDEILRAIVNRAGLVFAKVQADCQSAAGFPTRPTNLRLQ